MLDQALRRTRIDAVALDAGYDAEHTHEYARRERGVRTLIPPLIGRRTDKPPRGYWRRQMAQRLHLTRYGQRWQAETVNSMLKRLMGSALRARQYWSQCRETILRAITHNMMILRRMQVFYGAHKCHCRLGNDNMRPFHFIGIAGSGRGKMSLPNAARRRVYFKRPAWKPLSRWGRSSRASGPPPRECGEPPLRRSDRATSAPDATAAAPRPCDIRSPAR